MSNTRYRLLVFDWDGTLANSEHRIIEAVGLALEELGLPQRSADEIRNVIGLGMQECLETLFPDIEPERHAGFINTYRKHFTLRNNRPVSLFPGVRDVLTSLRGGGYELAVATGKSRRGLDRELKESGLDAVIKASRCADESPSKPHPGMLEDLLEQTFTPAEEALMIGDTTYDMQMARDAGVDRVGVSYGAHETARLLEYGPLEIVDSVHELQQWLSNQAARSEGYR